jgi:hypothetical protein
MITRIHVCNRILPITIPGGTRPYVPVFSLTKYATSLCFNTGSVPKRPGPAGLICRQPRGILRRMLFKWRLGPLGTLNTGTYKRHSQRKPSHCTCAACSISGWQFNINFDTPCCVYLRNELGVTTTLERCMMFFAETNTIHREAAER